MSSISDPTTLQIVQFPHPALRHKSLPIRRVDTALREIVRRMFDLMYEARGIGLAANQVDLPLRLFIVNSRQDSNGDGEMVFINPVLSRPKGVEESEEGCLSFPQLYGPVTRPKRIHVQAYGLDGKEISADLDGLLSRVVQHETDHLDGVLFTDRMSMSSRMEVAEVLEGFELEFRRKREAGEIPSDDEIAARLKEWERQYC